MHRSTATRAAACAMLAASAGAARGDVTYTLQSRTIEATTTANNNTVVVTAPNFGPFVESLNLETPFTTPEGGTATNAARVGIDCQLDPNAVRVSGSLAGAGGLSVVGGTPTVQFGEAATRIDTQFVLAGAIELRMTASARPAVNPNDRYKIRLKNETTGQIVFELDETSPPQVVDFRTTLQPALYDLEFQVELTIDGPEALSNFYFNAVLGQCYANCDESTDQPSLTANDFICFLNRFARGDTWANCDGGTTTPLLTANDFLCFLSKYSSGCS